MLMNSAGPYRILKILWHGASTEKNGCGGRALIHSYTHIKDWCKWMPGHWETQIEDKRFRTKQNETNLYSN